MTTETKIYIEIKGGNITLICSNNLPVKISIFDHDLIENKLTINPDVKLMTNEDIDIYMNVDEGKDINSYLNKL